MALSMAEKMKKNPELMPTPEELQAQLEATGIGQPGAATKPATGSKKPSGYKTSGNAASTLPSATTASGGIENARHQLQAQMREMEEEQARLEAQQQQLADLASSGDAESFARFLLSQGLTESQVTNMMERPGDPAGLELLKQTLDISMGINPTADGAEHLKGQLDKVDEMAEKIAQLEAMDAAQVVEDEIEEDVEEFSTDGATALRRAQAKKKVTKKAGQRQATASMTAAERKMQKDIAEMQTQMAQAKKAAEESAGNVAKAKAELEKAKSEYEEVNEKVAEAGNQVDEAAAAAAAEDAERKKKESADAAAYDAAIAKRKEEYAAASGPAGALKPSVRPSGASTAAFIPADTFEGVRQGHVFKNGSAGVGYYPCPIEQAKSRAITQPEEDPQPPSPTHHRQAPAYKLEQIRLASGDGTVVLRWTVELPLLTGIKDVDLDLTEKAVRLGSSQYADLELELPGDVNPDTAKAKWMKKTKQLRVDMPLINVGS